MLNSRSIIHTSKWNSPTVENPLHHLLACVWSAQPTAQENAIYCLRTQHSWDRKTLQKQVFGFFQLAQHELGPTSRVVVSNDESSDAMVLAAFLGFLLAGCDVILPMSNHQGLWESLEPLKPDAVWGNLDSTNEMVKQLPLFPPLDDMPTAPLIDAIADPHYWVHTSGSTGKPKWIEHSITSLAKLLVAHQRCGLLAADKLGGTLLCPLFSHTMGIRSALLCLYAGQTIVFVSAVDWDEHPVDIVEGLRAHPPQVLYAGPGLLRDIIRFMEFFPVLQRELLPKLNAVVSSGAIYDEELVQRFPETTFVNAFGMSETHVLSNGLLAAQDQNRIDALMPGVRFRLEPLEHHYRLWVSSPYMGIRYAGEEPFEEWLDTGDRVDVDAHGGIVYVDRIAGDFIQNGSGWKLSRRELQERHQPFPQWISHIYWGTCAQNRNISALIWIGEEDPADQKIHSDIVEWFIFCHRRWEKAGDSPLLIQQYHCTSVGILHGEPPTNRLGKIVLGAEQQLFLERVADPLVFHPHKVEIPSCYGETGLFSQLFPRRSVLLSALNLDWEYVDGRGDILEGRRGLRKAEILDMVGGYGCTLLGHNYPPLQEDIRRKEWGISIASQGSRQPVVAQFCAELGYEVSQHSGRNYIVCPTTTGAEAVEVALKHCILQREKRFERYQNRCRESYANRCPELVREVLAHNQLQFDQRKPPILGLKKAFHGKSLATLALLGEPSQRKMISNVLSLRREFVPVDGGAAAQKQLKNLEEVETLVLWDIVLGDEGWHIAEHRIPDILAVIIEPILGEGGIWEVPLKWGQRLAQLQAPLICDEIQSGLGRSGAFLASSGIRSDIILLGKSLGGGEAKISATLIDRAIYEADFDDIRSATYSEANRAAWVARRVLFYLKKESAMLRAALLGTELKQKLKQVQQEFSTVITAVRGRGLMLGIEFQYPNNPKTVALKALSAAGLGYLIASYLLNQHAIRCLPTTSSPNVLRLEPSIHLQSAHIEKIVNAFRCVSEALSLGNLFELSVHLISDDEELNQKRKLASMYMKRPKTSKDFLIQYEEPQQDAIRIAFVHDPVNIQKLLLADCPAFGLLSTAQRLKLLQKFELLLGFAPMPSFGKNLMQGSVWMRGYTMPILSQTISYLCRRKEFSIVQPALQLAVEQAEEEGCRVIVMGAQTSVLSRNGTTLLPRKPETILCSGNSFTTASIIHNIRQQIEKDSVSSIAILGALGNIGSALAEYFAVYSPSFQKHITLVGRQGSETRLQARCHQLKSQNPSSSVSWETDLQMLRTHELIIIAISGQSLLDERYFQPGDHCIIADISQPPALSKDLPKYCPQLQLISPAMVRLPFDHDFQISAHSASGEIFACAAEGIVTALRPHHHSLVGEISAEVVHDLLQSGLELQLLSSKPS